MAYTVTVTNIYQHGETLSLEFNSESVLFSDVIMDADIEIYNARFYSRKSVTAMPIFQTITAFPLEHK